MQNGRLTVPLVILVGFMILLSVAAIVVIVLRAQQTTDELALIGAIVAFMAPLITSVIALIVGSHADGTATAVKRTVEAHLNNESTPPSPSA